MPVPYHLTLSRPSYDNETDLPFLMYLLPVISTGTLCTANCRELLGVEGGGRGFLLGRGGPPQKWRTQPVEGVRV